MNKYFLLTNLIQKPVLELNYALIQREINSGNKVYILICKPILRSFCSINPFGSISICHICKNRSKLLSQIDNVNVININPNVSNDIKFSITLLKKIRNGVMSCIASHLRITNYLDLNNTWKKVYKNIFKSSLNLYGQLSKLNLDGDLFIFNGRFDWGRTSREYCISNGIDYIVYDQKWSHTFFSFKNSSIHSAAKNIELCESFYKSSNEIEFNEKSKDFFEKRSAGLPLIGKNYSLNFDDKKTDNFDIVIFPSSSDEYIFTDDFDDNAKFPDQCIEICNFLNTLDNQSQFSVAIRLHPNMSYMTNNYLSNFYKIESNYKNIKVFKPTDNINSYKLFKNSKYTIFFASTIGFEAAYYGINSIQVGPSFFSKMNITPVCMDGYEAATLINKKKEIKVNIHQAKKWAYYSMSYNEDLPGFNQVTNGVYTINGNKISFTWVHIVFLLIAKFRIEISKGTLGDIFKRRFKIYSKLQNIILGRNSV
jgi:hypothetical protein